MVARIDWINNCIDNMIAGKRPIPPSQWGGHNSIKSRDVDLLRQAAQFVSLRSGVLQIDPNFVAQARSRILAETAIEE